MEWNGMEWNGMEWNGIASEITDRYREYKVIHSPSGFQLWIQVTHKNFGQPSNFKPYRSTATVHPPDNKPADLHHCTVTCCSHWSY